MEINKGYKMTDVGVIPEDWEVKSIGEVLSICNGMDYKHLNIGNYPVYGTGGLIAKVDDYLFEGESVCIGRKGTIDAPIYLNEKFWTVDTLFYTMNFVGVLPKFIYYLFNKIDWLSLNEASGVPSLSKDNIKLQLIQTPNLSEQQAIADALTKVDNLITSLTKVIEKKKLIKKGAMQKLLSGEMRLDGFEGEWERKQIGKIGITYSGITGKNKSDFGHGTAKYITFLNVLNNPIINTKELELVDISSNENQNKALKGDLFFNVSSETPEEVGICSVLLDDISNLYVNSFCFGFRITDKEVSGIYLSYLFRTSLGRDKMSSIAQGATRYNLSKDYFNEIELTIPPTKAEQTAIANILTTMDNEIEALEKERDKYKCIKQGMMQQLLTGKIRLTCQ